MLTCASGLGMGVDRCAIPWRGVGVIIMLDAGLDTTRCVEFPPGAGVLRLLLPGVGLGVFIDHQCVADVVEVTR
jgi:hypothetical protein